MITIIIPTRNECELLERTLRKVREHDVDHLVSQVLVVDAHSTDGTVKLATSLGVQVVTGNEPSRSAQMNQGAALAATEILYFLHGDSYPPKGFSTKIRHQVSSGNEMGCFMSQFDWPHFMLRACNWFSRFPYWWCRGGGQSLFITKAAFERTGGFNEQLKLMEEYEFIERARKTTGLAIIKEYVVTSARDYRANGAFWQQLTYGTMFRMYAKGASQEELREFLDRKLSARRKALGRS